jgi:hypothetical protein
MNEPVDWTDETLRPLDELARIAFPAGAGVTADTLKRRARQGKLAVFRPGKAYLATLADVWAMLEATRVQPKSPPGPEAGSASRRFSRSEMERPDVVQARVLAKLEALRRTPKRP